MNFSRRMVVLISILTVSLGAALVFLSTDFSVSQAISPRQQPTPNPTTIEPPAGTAPDQLSVADSVCLGCHGQPGTTMTLENGEVWDLSVNPDDHASSIHGKLGYACVQCHRQVGEYPHPVFDAADRRDATLKLNTACQYCHAYQAELNQDGVHARAIASGVREAAVCVDCHSAHSVQQIFDPKTHLILPDARLRIPQTCAKCHSAIYEKYRESVHGAALTDEQNPDVPTCIDCHGVHNISDPTTAEFRLKSPEICAKCHTNPAIMDKYGISTDVLQTYVADFHGTTQVLFEQLTPDQQFNKPVCYDCHGIHDIARPDDPNKGLEVRENLLHRCQVCHPDATTNFPGAWLSHYIPSPDKYPAVFYVNLFYKFFIPTVLGGMALLVVLDISRKARDWLPLQEFVKSANLRLKRLLAGEINPESILDAESTSNEDAEEETTPAEASSEAEPADQNDGEKL